MSLKFSNPYTNLTVTYLGHTDADTHGQTHIETDKNALFKSHPTFANKCKNVVHPYNEKLSGFGALPQTISASAPDP